MSEAFPFGVPARPDDEQRDRRGPDTTNRLLLHGARYHDRPALFLDWEAGRQGDRGWQGTPDWRADRAAIRVGLVLGQRLGLARGEAVAVWLPLSRELACIERGCWSIGAVSVPVWPEWDLDRVAAVLADARPQVLFAPDAESLAALRVTGRVPESVRACIVMRGQEEESEDALPFVRFMDHGGVLDTPERASMWRTTAREAKPDAVVAWEYGEPGEARGDVDQAALVRAAAALLDRFPPRRGRVWALADDRPDLLSRAAVCAAWADGLTRVAFAGGEEARGRLAELEPELVLCRGADAPGVAAAFEEGAGEGAARNGARGGARRKGPVYFALTDRPEVDPGLAARRGGWVRFVPRAELGAIAGLPVS